MKEPIRDATPDAIQPNAHSEDSGAYHRFMAKRERKAIRRALECAIGATRFLHVPCGLGASWDILLEQQNATVIGADHSLITLDLLNARYPDKAGGKVHFIQASAANINLPDGSVDCIFCPQLLSNVDITEQRMAILHEFARLTSGWLIISLTIKNQFSVLPEDLFKFELAKAGFVITQKIAVLPFLSPINIYVAKLRC